MEWLLAGVIVAAVAVALRQPVVALFAVLFAAWFAGYALRLEIGVRIARRDVERGDSAPRRAFVAQIHDPSSGTMRPLLAVWDHAPRSGERLPRADLVLRTDDELDDLETWPHELCVHEAWVDTGPRRTSKPRWVVADAGIAVPHRRKLLGRWYLRLITRRAQVSGPMPLTVGPPSPGPTTGDPPDRDGPRVRSVAWRCVGVALFALVGLFFD